MRLLELEIQNIRGIRHLKINPDGKNLVVLGPNGSGKSTVVDALDFLLTGKISRLTGEGTGNISLRRHGPHIDCDPEQAWVRAKFKVIGVNEPVEITRHMDQPNEYECPGCSRSQLEPILNLANRGQHVLTRREILKYITSEGGTRAAEIQALLDINEIEDIRKNLVKVFNECKKAWSNADTNLKQSEGRIQQTTNSTSFQEGAVLAFVNQQRAIFKASPLSRLASSEIKQDILLPVATQGTQTVNTSTFNQDFSSISAVFSSERRTQMEKWYSRLLELVDIIRQDPDLMKDIAKSNFLSTGLDLIPEDGGCPFCETHFEPGVLEHSVHQRLEVANKALPIKRELDELVRNISVELNATLSGIQHLLAVAEQVKHKDATRELKRWETEIKRLISILSRAVTFSSFQEIDKDLLLRQYAPDDIDTILENLRMDVHSKFPAATPELTAWTLLTRLEENLKTYEAARLEVEKCELHYRRSDILLDEFQKARDYVLGKLYREVRDRFVELYRIMHAEDEASFNAVLEPDGPALKFEVDFHGHGMHAPHALHSEGHQDSMGLCLYLALAERLTGGILDLLILDDVVMSVDADHRRQLCRLLAKAFPHRQFLITTHDLTWASQLRTEGVVSKKELIEFFNWNLDCGPQINCDNELWTRIEEDMAANHIPEAAAHLRRGSEEFFAQVCEALRAPVVFKQSGRFELGELMHPAKGQLKKLIKLAKISASSFGRTEIVKSLALLDDTISEVFTRTDAEQWAVNENVHYNQWANFTREDFRPVVDAFHEFFGLFTCPECEGFLRVVMQGNTMASLQCNCGSMHWSLMEKKPTE